MRPAELLMKSPDAAPTWTGVMGVKGSQAAAATMLIQVPKELDAANLTYLQRGRVRRPMSVESWGLQMEREGHSTLLQMKWGK